MHERLEAAVGRADERRAVDEGVAGFARVRPNVTGEAAFVGVEADGLFVGCRAVTAPELEGAERQLAPLERRVGRDGHCRSQPVVVKKQCPRSTGRIGEHELGPIVRLVAIPETVAAGHPMRRHRSAADERVHIPREQALGAVVTGDVDLLGVGNGSGTDGQAGDGSDAQAETADGEGESSQGDRGKRSAG